MSICPERVLETVRNRPKKSNKKRGEFRRSTVFIYIYIHYSTARSDQFSHCHRAYEYIYVLYVRDSSQNKRDCNWTNSYWYVKKDSYSQAGKRISGHRKRRPLLFSSDRVPSVRCRRDFIPCRRDFYQLQPAVPSIVLLFIFATCVCLLRVSGNREYGSDVIPHAHST